MYGHIWVDNYTIIRFNYKVAKFSSIGLLFDAIVWLLIIGIEFGFAAFVIKLSSSLSLQVFF